MIRLCNPNSENLTALIANVIPFSEDSEFIRPDLDHAAKAYGEIVRNGMGEIFVMEDDDTRDFIGALACLKAPGLHDGKLMAIELFWYVTPKHRKGGKGLDLWYAFENWAKEQGCQQMAMIHMADSMPDILEKLYISRGYRLLEKHYVKDIKKEG